MLSTPVSGGLLFTDSDLFDSSSALEQTCTRTPRTTVFELRDAVARGAIVVDIRPQAQRAVQGTLPGALARATDLVGGYRALQSAGLLGVLTGARHSVREAEAISAH